MERDILAAKNATCSNNEVSLGIVHDLIEKVLSIVEFLNADVPVN